MNEFWKGVLSTIAVAILAGAFGYIILVEKMTVKIEGLESKILDMSSEMKSTGSNINAIKLFVVAAHPDSNIISLTSAKKLQSLSSQELMVLGSALSFEYIETGVGGIKSHPAKAIIREHSITNEDLQSYIEAVNVGQDIWDVDYKNIDQ